jgi:hypothetical protein
MWEEVLLPTVKAEALPLLAPPILLEVVLPELGGGLYFYVFRMTSSEAILKPRDFRAKTAFLGGARPVVEAP